MIFPQLDDFPFIWVVIPSVIYLHTFITYNHNYLSSLLTLQLPSFSSSLLQADIREWTMGSCSLGPENSTFRRHFAS